MSYITDILKLSRQLLPRGRAFKGPVSGWLDSLLSALSLRENQMYQDILSPLDAILPDNPRFTPDDATDWERRLGLVTYPGVSFADRKLAIAQKINYPGDVRARQHWLYLQGQLRAAGFDVYVFENRFRIGSGPYFTQDPVTLSGGLSTAYQLADHQLGDAQLGGTYTNIVANYIDEPLDNAFTVVNLRSTFFIGGITAGSFATVPLVRKDEFRRLILRLKPVQTIAYLFIIYN